MLLGELEKIVSELAQMLGKKSPDQKSVSYRKQLGSYVCTVCTLRMETYKLMQIV